MKCPECGTDGSLFLHYEEVYSYDTGPYDEEWYRCSKCLSTFDKDEVDEFEEW